MQTGGLISVLGGDNVWLDASHLVSIRLQTIPLTLAHAPLYKSASSRMFYVEQKAKD